MARTVAQVQADLDALYAARLKLVAGERVEEVRRDGRSLTFGKVTLDQIQALVAVLERELEQAQAVENGQARRRPIGVVYGN
jgi:hypothetical protein